MIPEKIQQQIDERIDSIIRLIYETFETNQVEFSLGMTALCIVMTQVMDPLSDEDFEKHLDAIRTLRINSKKPPSR